MRGILAFLLAFLMLFSGCSTVKQAVENAEEIIEENIPDQSEPADVPKESASEPEQPEPDEEVIIEPEFDAYAIIEKMNIEEKVGQIFLARCPDIYAVKDVSVYKFGGYILFARDFQDSTPEEVSEKVAEYQSAAKIPMLIAVDEEGGTVTRISRYVQFRPQGGFASPRYYYNKGGIDLVIEKEKEKCN